MIYPIYVYGSGVLRQDAADAAPEQVTGDLVENMFETMRHASGVGLAAPQIGMALRLFVVDLTMYADEEPSLADFRKVFINPEIYWASDEVVDSEEGCLSIPGIHENVARPVSVRIRYKDAQWNDRDEEYTGYPARVIQHEYDHLQSTVFTDRISPIRKTMIRGKLNSMSKGKFSADYKTKLR